MLTKPNLFFLVVIFIIAAVACKKNNCPDTKTTLINQFNQFVNTNLKSKLYYSIKEWETKDKEFTEYLQVCYPPLDTSMYLDERQKFWSDALRYYFKRYDERVTFELLNNKNPNSKVLQNQIKSTWANPDVAFQQIFQEMTGLKFDDAVNAVRDSTLPNQ